MKPDVLLEGEENRPLPGLPRVEPEEETRITWVGIDGTAVARQELVQRRDRTGRLTFTVPRERTRETAHAGRDLLHRIDRAPEGRSERRDTPDLPVFAVALEIVGDDEP